MDIDLLLIQRVLIMLSSLFIINLMNIIYIEFQCMYSSSYPVSVGHLQPIQINYYPIKVITINIS